MVLGKHLERAELSHKGQYLKYGFMRTMINNHLKYSWIQMVIRITLATFPESFYQNPSTPFQVLSQSKNK